MKVNKIFIITDAPIPIGFAPTNRILCYVNGFTANNMASEIIIFRKTQTNSSKFNKSRQGDINGVKYRYLHKTTSKSTSFIKRRIDNFISPILLFLFSLRKIKNNSAIIYYSSHTIPLFFLYLSKILKNDVLLLKEESEHPNVYIKNKGLLSKIIFEHFHYSLFDGFLLMTNSLISIYKKKFPKISRKLIPMTVNLSRFIKGNKQKFKYITYVGSLNNEKDGILDLIKAFKIFIKLNNEYKLLVCGFTSSNMEKKLFQEALNDNYITDKVIFEEDVKSTDIPDKLMKSSILVLPRPDSKQSKTAFPTKLGEYLASGTPVVVTAVGEIPNYLENQKTAYIIKPGDINSLSNSLIYIVNNYDKAIKVGQRGKKIAFEKFNNILQTKSIIDFINKY